MEKLEAAKILGALAQESRLQILRLLLEGGANGMPAGEIVERLGIPGSTTSFHLSALERVGLLQATRHGRSIVYATRISSLRELLSFLTETCCSGHPELCSDISNLLPEPAGKNDLMTPAHNVLFLCTRNSGRSIMAEVILKKLGGAKFNVYSAGSDPADAPMAAVLDKLDALGHPLDELRSKSWDEFSGPDAPHMDFVIALCDTLEGQVCPDFGDKAVTGAWPLPDPGKFSGSPTEQSTLLNELYTSLTRRLGIFISLPFATLDRTAARARLDDIGAGPVGVGAR